MADNRIYLCPGCRRGTGDTSESERDLLNRALANAGLDGEFAVVVGDCMGGCEAPVSIGFNGNGRAGYVFNGVSVVQDMDDILTFCRAYLRAEKGWIVDARALGRLRHCLRARVPGL
jgi:predicted metal-binding protein